MDTLAPLSRANAIASSTFGMDNVHRIVQWAAVLLQPRLSGDSAAFVGDFVAKLGDARLANRLFQSLLQVAPPPTRSFQLGARFGSGLVGRNQHRSRRRRSCQNCNMHHTTATVSCPAIAIFLRA